MKRFRRHAYVSVRKVWSGEGLGEPGRREGKEREEGEKRDRRGRGEGRRGVLPHLMVDVWSVA